MATTVVDAIFVDTNVLVYAAVANAPLHTTASQALVALSQAGSLLWISRQVLREYLAVLSRPQSFTQPLPASTLIADVQLFEQQFLVAEDGPQVTAALLNLLSTIPVGGRQIHDANIAATMRTYGISMLLTHNSADFLRFTPLITVLPL